MWLGKIFPKNIIYAYVPFIKMIDNFLWVESNLIVLS